MPNVQSTEHSEQAQPSSQETIAESLVEDNEQAVVMENTETTPMVTDEVTDEIESNEPVQNTVYPDCVCETPITVAMQTDSTGATISETNPGTESLPPPLQNPAVVAQAIIVSHAAVEEQLS